MMIVTSCIRPFTAFCLSCAAALALADDFAERRQQLAAAVAEDVIATRDYLGIEALSADVVNALSTVPRHLFVPQDQRNFAYQNRPLPIGRGQTISQPYIVAIMTELLQPKPDHTVLELGTGSGYQAAVLAALVQRVFSLEIVEFLGDQAADRLNKLGYDNVTVKVGDGYYGWQEHAPFDGIVVTAAGSHIPPPLIKQLKPGGRMVIPVGSRFMTQQLLLVIKQADGSVVTRQILPVRFVPLTGSH